METTPRKLIAAINMTVDGYCDHTAITPDEEIHDHYTGLVRNAGCLLYGRVTYQLMEAYWPGVAQNPTGNRSTDEFAVAIDNSRKMVFSRSLESVSWKNTELKHAIDPEEIRRLKVARDRYLLAGSPGLIVALTQLGLVDEYQLCVHPVIAGKGLPLFRHMRNTIGLTLERTKRFASGAIILYYAPGRKT